MHGLYTTFRWPTSGRPKHVVVISSQIVGGWQAFDTRSDMMDLIQEADQGLSRYGGLKYWPKGKPDHRINSMEEYAFCQYKYLQNVRASQTGVSECRE